MCLQIESQWKSIALGSIIALGLKTMLGLMSNAGAQSTRGHYNMSGSSGQAIPASAVTASYRLTGPLLKW